MAVVVVTGANGFTGRHLVPLLAAQGYSVHGVGRGVSADPLDGLAASHNCDIADAEQTADVIGRIKPDYVVHLAAISFVAHGDLFEMYRTNVLGTRSVLDACARLKRSPAAVLIASSANVYGKDRDGEIGEETEPCPANDYGVTKVATENLASIYGARIPVIVSRPFNYIGVGQDPSFLVAKIVDHIRRRAARIELGNMDVARDFMDVRVLVDTYRRLLITPDAIGQTFNVCTGRGTSLRELLSLSMEIARHSMEIAVNPEFVRASEVKYLVGNHDRIEATIGPLLSISLEDTLRWMIEA